MRSQKKTWLPIFVSLFELSAMTFACSAPYVVEGLTLGERVLGGSSYRSYSCKPSDNFEGLTWCERTQSRKTTQGTGILSTTIMHAEDGIAVYLMANITPVSISKNAAQAEIDSLSREIKERPEIVEWLPQRPGFPASVIALWGRVELQKLKPNEVGGIAAGFSPRRGVFVDSLGDLERSAKAGLPIYRIAGGAGYLYSASFDTSGRGHRHYVAIDVSQPAIKKFEPALHSILQKDQSRASNDYSLWPEVAFITRNLSLDTSPRIANEALDKVFNAYPSKKLHSHVWPLLPLGVIDRLSDHRFYAIDIYGPQTGYPEIRRNIQMFLAEHPSEPFSEMLYFTLGELDKALRANPKSIISDIIYYASGHKILETLLQETRKIVMTRVTPNTDEPVNETLVALNENPELYDHKLLSDIVPTFAARAAAARPWFEAVLREESSPQRDDAAYMIGWLLFHQGEFKEALRYMSQAMTVGNGDYKRPAAMRQTIRILAKFSPQEQLSIVASDSTFAQQPALWYVAARSAYRDFNFTLAIEAGERGLNMMKVPLDRLPVTTDPQEIKGALEKIRPQNVIDGDDLNLLEIPYLVEASREILQYQAYLKSAATEHPDNFSKRARAIVIKYSMLLDEPGQPTRRPNLPGAVHRDLRQAIHLIDMTLNNTPKKAQYTPLHEWLYYRKVRILVQFSPKKVSEAIASMEREFPKSHLMDDALAEQLYAEGVMLKDVSAAQRTFQKLITNYPRGNAVDNAYTWMAIIYRCAGRPEDAQRMNRDIMRLFPLTRHFLYARERASNPRAAACGLPNFSER